MLVEVDYESEMCLHTLMKSSAGLESWRHFDSDKEEVLTEEEGGVITGGQGLPTGPKSGPWPLMFEVRLNGEKMFSPTAKRSCGTRYRPVLPKLAALSTKAEATLGDIGG